MDSFSATTLKLYTCKQTNSKAVSGACDQTVKAICQYLRIITIVHTTHKCNHEHFHSLFQNTVNIIVSWFLDKRIT